MSSKYPSIKTSDIGSTWKGTTVNNIRRYPKPPRKK